MNHRTAPLTPVGRRGAFARVLERGRPISHVAAEFRISRAILANWVGRFEQHAEDWLAERSSAPARRPTRLPIETAELPSPCALVFGQEGPGLSDQIRSGAAATLSIAQYGSTRSINAGVAGGIAMHAWMRQHATP